MGNAAFHALGVVAAARARALGPVRVGVQVVVVRYTAVVLSVVVLFERLRLLALSAA
jgi:hypothetical protein